MKKMTPFVLLLTVVLLLTFSCLAEVNEADQARFEELCSANSTESILGRHASVTRMSTQYTKDNPDYNYNIYNYADPELTCWSELFYGDLCTRTQLISWVDALGCVFCISENDDLYAQWFQENGARCGLQLLNDEKLCFLQEKDGCITAETILDDDKQVRNMVQTDEIVWMGGYEYQEGMRLKYRYLFDADSSDLLRIDTWVVEADGTEHIFRQGEYSYEKVFDPYGLEQHFYEYYYAVKENDDVTVTVTFNPGTEEETIRKFTFPRSTYFYIYKASGDWADENVYTNPECTLTLEYFIANSDMHLYVK